MTSPHVRFLLFKLRHPFAAFVFTEYNHGFWCFRHQEGITIPNGGAGNG